MVEGSKERRNIMCRRLIYLICFVLVLCLVGDVQAADVTWTDATGDHLWSTAGNWDTGTLPTSADTVKIRIVPGPTVANPGAVANVVQPAASSSTGDLTVDGGTLTITDRLVVAQSEGSNGTLNMISGTITAGGNFVVARKGSGTLNMTGGTITVGGTLRIPETATATAHANLHGGIITANNLEMRAAGGVGTVDIRAGTLIINVDALSTVQGYIDNGWITAYDGNGTLHLDYDFTNPGKTTVKACEMTSAFNPIPAYGATDAPRDAVLSWTPGIYADKHDVYFGTNFNDVNDADRTNPLGVLVSQNQVPNSYSPAKVLQWEQTYYWRIDEVNAPPDYTIYKGNVWQFTVEPFAYPIAGTSITATASSQFSKNTGPENTINGSGMDADDLHSKEEADIWVSSMTGPQPTWIQYEFDRVYKLYEMWVWNHNTSIELVLGFGVKDATIEYSLDGASWTTLGTVEFARAPGAAGYAHNTTIDLAGVPAKYVKITANSNWGGVLNQYGLSEVRIFYIPVFAREPDPASGATDVDVEAVLSWREGREAASHNVNFSTDEQAVIDETAAVTTLTEASYGPLSLDLGQSYYWKVNEVNEAETPTTWQGDVWNFSTQEYLVVDDFEDYNDFEPDRVFDTWIDGWGIPANGSQVGSDMPPFAEQTIVHSGNQSMPLYYDNSTANYSEATANVANLPVDQDWTKYGIKTLSLWFYGDPTNAAEQMYVKVNDVKVVYGGGVTDIQSASWYEWNIELALFSVNLSNVTELSIGLERSGAVGGKGVVYIDDIRLYRLVPEPTE